jgi:hypothetical protein
MNHAYASNWQPPRGGEEVELRDLLPIDRYTYWLENIPPSGGGGAHQALLRIANLGRAAGLSTEQVLADLTRHVHGTRVVTPGEIQDAITKAFSTATPQRRTPRIVLTAAEGEQVRNAIIERGADFTEAKLLETSPVRIDWVWKRDGIEVLRRLYAPDEVLFLGQRWEAGAGNIQPAAEWIRRFGIGFIPPHIIPNPLTGKQGMAKDGELSYRADACVASFRFCVLEFDTLPRAQQIQFWAGAKLDIAAIVDSGGKSLHAWIRVDADDEADWRVNIEEKLFDVLGAVGIDSSCKNEARLSRTPGHPRAGKRPQRLLYLAPEGRQVQP